MYDAKFYVRKVKGCKDVSNQITCIYAFTAIWSLVSKLLEKLGFLTHFPFTY